MQKRILHRTPVSLLLGALGALIWFSMYLAAFRIYQVDECTETYVARILAMGQAQTQSPGHLTLFQVLLSTVVHGDGKSADLLTAGRFLMVEIFWLNIFLIALATKEKLRSSWGLAALLGAATLAPLWDYGFEIRHDNLLLTGLLLIWCLIRLNPVGPQASCMIGALTVGLQFVAFKAFVYTVPLSLLLFIFPPPGLKSPRWKLAVAWAAGALGTFLIVRTALGAAGWWDLFVSGSQFLGTVSSGGRRFGPEMALGRLLSQTPLLLALVVAAFVKGFGEWRRRGRAFFTWDDNMPEALLLLLTLGALIINPAPFPYNLLFLVPFAFLFAFRYAKALIPEFRGHPAFAPVAVAILLFTHLGPFGVATRRHLDWPNSRQVILMALAESLTDPAKDRVYDGVFMVVARPVDQRWFLHSFNVKSFINGDVTHVRDMLAQQPAAVFIPNYRTDWLPSEDHAYIQEHYVSLADDFWVLGKVLPAGGGEFEIIHPGRYCISPLKRSRIAGTYSNDMQGLMETSKPLPADGSQLVATLDDHALADAPVELAVGAHHIATDSKTQLAVVWVGPKLDRPPVAGFGDHRRLFFNWY